MNRIEPIVLRHKAFGLGDAIMAGYAMRGLEQAGHSAILHCRKPNWSKHWVNPEWVRPWKDGAGHELNGDKDDLRKVHHKRIDDPTKPTRPQFYLENAGFPDVRPVKPPLDDLPGPDSRATGRILMFPFTTHINRDWVTINWVHLARLLGAQGLTPRLMTIARDNRKELDWFKGVTYWHGLSLEELIGLVRAADLVISNDSGPAHLAAVLGTPVVIISAQVDPFDLYSIYRDPGVTIAAPQAGKCSPCSWQPKVRGVPGYHPSTCNASCFMLQSVTPIQVAEIALDVLLDGAPPEISIVRPPSGIGSTIGRPIG